MAGTDGDTRRTALDVCDQLSRLMLRLALQAFPVFLTIAAANYIGRHL
jgi:hypothetical protein